MLVYKQTYTVLTDHLADYVRTRSRRFRRLVFGRRDSKQDQLSSSALTPRIVICPPQAMIHLFLHLKGPPRNIRLLLRWLATALRPSRQTSSLS